jgi:hypothetical protein
VERCYFAKEAPDVELRGGLVFIVPKNGHCEIALSPATLTRFVAAANRVLRSFHDDNRDPVALRGEVRAHH